MNEYPDVTFTKQHGIESKLYFAELLHQGYAFSVFGLWLK